MFYYNFTMLRTKSYNLGLVFTFEIVFGPRQSIIIIITIILIMSLFSSFCHNYYFGCFCLFNY